jgi:hypothetical protein
MIVWEPGIPYEEKKAAEMSSERTNILLIVTSPDFRDAGKPDSLRETSGI